MSAKKEPVGIVATEEEYATIVLIMSGGDFARGQRWVDTANIPFFFNSFAEGQETPRP